MANMMDRPLPPLPLMQSPPYLQKERSPKRRHTRNVSSLDLPQPFASIQASITPLSSPPPITSTTIPPLPLQPRKQKLRKGRLEEYKQSLVPPQPFANVRASSMPGTPVIPIAPITVPPKSSISPVSSRRSLSNSASDTEMTGTTRLRKRSTWFSSSRSKSRSRNFSQDMDKLQVPAWTSQDGIRVPYPLRALTDGQKVCLNIIRTCTVADIFRSQNYGQRPVIVLFISFLDLPTVLHHSEFHHTCYHHLDHC